MSHKKRGKSLIFNRKKGMTHEIFFNIFELVLAAVIALALFNFIADVTEQTIFEKNYLARDLALVINVLYSAPGEVVYNYNEDTSQFELEFYENNVKVYKPEEGEVSRNIFYLFAENKNIPFRYKVIEPKKASITFSKSDEKIDIIQPSSGQNEEAKSTNQKNE